MAGVTTANTFVSKINETVLLTNTVVWTDYKTVQLSFSCGTKPSDKSLFHYFLISARDRNFNDLPILNKLLDILQSIDTTDDTLIPVYQGQLCTNAPNGDGFTGYGYIKN
jgi:hypothetical protein